MKFSNTLYAIASILAAADAATITEYVTAATRTVWHTQTLQSIYTTRTQLATVYGAPPNYGESTDSYSSTLAPPQTSSYTSSEETSAAISSSSSSASASGSSSSSSLSLSSSSSSSSSESSSAAQSSLSTAESTSTSAPSSSSSSLSSSSEPATSTTEEADHPTEDIEFANDILAAHNYYRELHQVGDLVWNDTLYQFAKNYVNTAFDCANLKLVHSNYPPYGENLAAGYVGGSSPVVDGWYGGEINLVTSWDPISYNQSTGHLTQLLWRSSTQLGCARLNCTNPNDSPNWRQITLCNYYPRGNIIGTNSTDGNTYFVDNVFPAKE